MKRILYSILLAGLAMAFIPSCIKDTGDYDYNYGNEVRITFSTYSYNTFLKDSVRVIPIRRFSNPQDTAEFNHEWYINGKKFSEGKELKIASDTLATYVAFYHMIDKKSGVRFPAVSQVTINVISPFQSGWGILYEKDNQSELAHVGFSQNKYLNYIDLYKTYNDGEVLGSQPVKLRDYPLPGWGNGSAMMVLQNGGQGPVEMNAYSFKKRLVIKDAFSAGAPANFTPVDMNFLPTTDFLVNADGKLYSRIFTSSSIPYTVPWLSTPVDFPGGIQIGDIWDTWSQNISYTILYDKLNKRLLYCWLYVPNEKNPGVTLRTMLTPDGGYPANYTPLNNFGTWEYVWGGTFNDNYHDVDGALLLRNPADNQLYYQSFDMAYRDNTQNAAITPTGRKLFNGGAFVTPNSKFATLKTRDYLVFSGGADNKSIYYYDVRATNPAIKYIDLPSAVTAIAASDDSQNFAVGLEDGTFIIFDLSNQTIIDGVSKELHRLTGLGKVVDVVVKGGNMR